MKTLVKILVVIAFIPSTVMAQQLPVAQNPSVIVNQIPCYHEDESRVEFDPVSDSLHFELVMKSLLDQVGIVLLIREEIRDTDQKLNKAKSEKKRSQLIRYWTYCTDNLIDEEVRLSDHISRYLSLTRHSSIFDGPLPSIVVDLCEYEVNLVARNALLHLTRTVTVDESQAKALESLEARLMEIEKMIDELDMSPF